MSFNIWPRIREQEQSWRTRKSNHERAGAAEGYDDDDDTNDDNGNDYDDYDYDDDDGDNDDGEDSMLRFAREI